MPIYEYRCECGRELEELRKASEVHAECVCPDCGKRMEKKLSAHAGVRVGASRTPSCGRSCEPGPGCAMPSCPGGTCGFDN